MCSDRPKLVEVKVQTVTSQQSLQVSLPSFHCLIALEAPPSLEALLESVTADPQVKHLKIVQMKHFSETFKEWAPVTEQTYQLHKPSALIVSAPNLPPHFVAT